MPVENEFSPAFSAAFDAEGEDVMASPMTWIEAPARPPRSNTSLDTIPVHNVSADHFTGLHFTADPCTFPGTVPQDCYVQIGPAVGTEKTFGDPSVLREAPIFGVYSGIECFLNGGINEFRDVARRTLEAGEHYAVDGVLYGILQPGSAPTTPGSTTSIVQAVALLEQTLATNVPAQGYIYMSPALVTYAVSENLLIRNLDGTLETYLGTPVVVLTAAMGLTAYASGPINIWRTEVELVDAPSWTTNMGRALAERLYSLAIECGIWRVTFTAPVQGGNPEPPPGTDLEMLLGSIPSSPIPDGTDTTIITQTNVVPQNEVYLWYAVNGGAPVMAGEMTQIDTHQFVWNVVGDSTTTGDTVEVWSVSEWDGADVESNHIIIEVT